MPFESKLGDWVAIYAAIIATLALLPQLWSLFFGGPKVSVDIINPRELKNGNDKKFKLVLSNFGSIPVVVTSVKLRFSKSNNRNATAFDRCEFDSKTTWNPAEKLIADPDKAESFIPVTNVLQQGDEIQQRLTAFPKYDPLSHWIHAEVKVRNSRRSFFGQSDPVIEGET